MKIHIVANFLLFTLVTACAKHSSEGKMTNDPVISIRLGENGASLLRRQPRLVKAEKQPAGLDFYNIRWSTSSPGTINIVQGVHSFTLDHAISIVGFQNSDFPDEGIPQFDISAGITAPDFITHDAARQEIFALFRRIQAAGWRATIPRSRPRLRGRDMLSYYLTSSKYTTLDPAYIVTLEEWMTLRNRATWAFYLDRAFLEINFSRDATLTELGKPGAYLLSITMKNEAEHFRGYLPSSERNRWKESLPASLSKLPAERAKAEMELRMKGIKIDESYEDPPVPTL